MTTKEKRGTFIFVAMFLGTGATGALLTISANGNDMMIAIGVMLMTIFVLSCVIAARSGTDDFYG